MTASAKEVIAAGMYESWANYPACTASDPWKVRSEKLPGSAEMFRKHATAILAALDAAGFVVVPREPTEAMIGAGGVEQFKADMAQSPPRDATMAIYRAMIAAQEKQG